MEEIVNKVAQSGIITFNLEELYDPRERVFFDMKEHLFMGLILKEKDFREFVKTNDWTQYAGKNVAIGCTADAIVPTWAYMLVANRLAGIAAYFAFGDLKTLEFALYQKELAKINPEDYTDKRVVVKGCSDLPVPESAYLEITRLLTPYVKTLMYGEPCSTVPIYKK